MVWPLDIEAYVYTYIYMYIHMYIYLYIHVIMSIDRLCIAYSTSVMLMFLSWLKTKMQYFRSKIDGFSRQSTPPGTVSSSMAQPRDNEEHDK